MVIRINFPYQKRAKILGNKIIINNKSYITMKERENLKKKKLMGVRKIINKKSPFPLYKINCGGNNKITYDSFLNNNKLEISTYKKLTEPNIININLNRGFISPDKVFNRNKKNKINNFAYNYTDTSPMNNRFLLSKYTK